MIGMDGVGWDGEEARPHCPPPPPAPLFLQEESRSRGAYATPPFSPKLNARVQEAEEERGKCLPSFLNVREGALGKSGAGLSVCACVFSLTPCSSHWFFLT